MKINQNGIVFNTAYAFVPLSQRPKGRVGGCTLLQRFIFFGALKVVVNVLFLALVIVCMIATPIYAVWSLLWAKRLSEREVEWASSLDPSTVVWSWLEAVPNSFIALSYVAVPIRSWPRIMGKRIVPFWTALMLLLVWVQVSLVQYGFSLEWTPENLVGRFVDSDLGVRVLFAEAAAALAALMIFVLILMSRSELGQLMQAWMRSLKERTCPVVEIVE